VPNEERSIERGTTRRRGGDREEREERCGVVYIGSSFRYAHYYIYLYISS
jgi:hypothetical protein